MITIPSLNDVTDILDTDMIMVTQQSGQSYKIAGSELNKRGKIIIANSTTITGAPLKAGSSVRVYFTVDLTAANASTTLQLNYNNVNYYVKAPKDGTLINFVATNLGGSPAVFKYLQKYTTLELLFDGTQFVIIGNPVILSSADYTIYADGKKIPDFIKSSFSDSYRKVGTNYLTSTNKKIKLSINSAIAYRSTIDFIIEITSNGGCEKYLLSCASNDSSAGGVFSNLTKLNSVYSFTIETNNTKIDENHYEVSLTVNNISSGSNLRVTVHCISYIDYSLQITA